MTSLRVGGPMRECVAAREESEIISAVRDAKDRVLIVAGGSNLVVADKGFDGTVVRIESRGLRVDGTRVTAAAGEPWDDVVGATVDAGLAGLECLSGIPGSAGATPIQNVGAYGQEVADALVSVRAYDRATDRIVELPCEECGFGYRTSRFKQDDYVILSVSFDLRRSPLGRPLTYSDLCRHLSVAEGAQVPLRRVREAVRALRREKGMLIDPDCPDPESVSAGSFFKNVFVDPGDAEALGARAGIELDARPENDGRVKVSAARLMVAAGFNKGYPGPGAARLSRKHVLALVNGGGATTAELMDLAREIRDVVWNRFGVELQPEPTLVGVAL